MIPQYVYYYRFNYNNEIRILKQNNPVLLNNNKKILTSSSSTTSGSSKCQFLHRDSGDGAIPGIKYGSMPRETTNVIQDFNNTSCFGLKSSCLSFSPFLSMEFVILNKSRHKQANCHLKHPYKLSSYC